MVFLLCFFIFNQETLWLNSGQKLICERYQLIEDQVIVYVDGQRYSFAPERVDWTRTRRAVAQKTEPRPDRLPGIKLETQIESPANADERARRPLTDLMIDKLSVKDIDLIELLRFMADMADINMVIDGSVPQGKATYHFRNIAWTDAFRIILENANLDQEYLYGAVRIKPL